MQKGLKRTVAFLFFIIAGAAAGSVIARLCGEVPWLEWLSWGESVGISPDSPAVIDLIVLKVAFGFSLSVNIAQIICIIAAILVFGKTCKSL